MKLNGTEAGAHFSVRPTHLPSASGVEAAGAEAGAVAGAAAPGCTAGPPPGCTHRGPLAAGGSQLAGSAGTGPAGPAPASESPRAAESATAAKTHGPVVSNSYSSQQNSQK